MQKTHYNKETPMFTIRKATLADIEVIRTLAAQTFPATYQHILTPEQIEKYEPYFYYVDMDIVRAQEEEDVIVDTDAIAAKGNLTLEEIHELAATRMDPSTMGDPVPVGIVMTDSPFATESHSYDDLVPVFGISVTTQRVDTCLQFLDYLWDDTVDFSLAHDEATPY